MACRHHATALLLAALASLTACGDLPRPFAPPNKAPNDLLLTELLRLDDRDLILVEPAAGPAAPALDGLAVIMANTLAASGISAATDPAAAALRVLTCRASLRPIAPGRAEVILLWELRGLGDETIGRYATRREVRVGAKGTVAPAVLADVAAEAAAAVARFAEPTPPRTAGIPGSPGGRLVILPLTDAPGDAAASLPRALRAELEAAGLPLGDRIKEEDVLILGTIDLAPPRGDLQQVEIRWLLVRAHGDMELGEIAQRSQVRAGSLDDRWGPIARDVARGAVAGVVDLLRRVSASRAPLPTADGTI